VKEFHLEEALDDGTPVLYRLLDSKSKEDIDELKKGFEKLSEYSRYCRFLIRKGEIAEEHYEQIANIDNIDHLALCAIDLSKDPQAGMGIARYVRVEKEPDVAEAAVTVIDEYQKKGLGTKLLTLLVQLASEHGINRFRAHVLSTNKGMMKILKRHGAQIRYYGGSLNQIDFPLEILISKVATPVDLFSLFAQ
jgi:RimJ/RimL family protein N-acetyltransferase